MAERDKGSPVVLFSDVPGDEERVHDILAQWGLEERAIRRLLREHRAASAEVATTDSAALRGAPRERTPN